MPQIQNRKRFFVFTKKKENKRENLSKMFVFLLCKHVTFEAKHESSVDDAVHAFAENKV